LRTLHDHLGTLIRAEDAAVAIAVVEPIDVDGQAEAHRKQRVALQSFIGTARTCWNYLNQLTAVAGSKEWLVDRLGVDPLCRFHRELANQELHDYPTTPGVEQAFKFTMDPASIVHVAPGAAFANGAMHITGPAGPPRYYYNVNDLSPEAAAQYVTVLKTLGKRTIVELALAYYDALAQTVKSGERRGRFGPVVQAGSARPTVLNVSIDKQVPPF
jgi:hypothetical protein